MPQNAQRVNARPRQSPQEARRPRLLTVIQGGIQHGFDRQVPVQRHVNDGAREPFELISRVDAPARAQIVSQLQRTHGNAHVQRVLLGSQGSHSSPAVRVQRCGSKACNCSPDERAAHDATEKIERGMDMLNSIDVAGEIQRTTGGSALHPEARSRLEPAMGLDLGHVTIHADGEADRLSRSVDAEAFTSGNHIFFRNGRYDPLSPAGLRLLAHEITHTVQQASGSVAGVQHFGGLQVNEPGDAHEQEAERKADDALQRLATGNPANHVDLPAGGGSSSARRPANVQLFPVQRSSSARLSVIQRTPTTDNGQGLSATWTPFASVNGPPFFQQTNFDTDGFHEEFNVPPKSSGRIIMLADVVWKKSAAGPGPTPPGPTPPGPTPPGPLPIPTPPGAVEACDPCTKIPTIAPQPDLDACFAMPDLCTRRAIANALLTKYTTDPCELISPNAPFVVQAAKFLCKGSVFLFKATGVGALIFGGIDLLRQGLAALLSNPICAALGCAPIKPTPGPNPKPTPTAAQEGKGRATIETRFFVGVDGKIQVVGLPPRIQASGAGAELVSPVEFIRTELPDGVNIAFQPMLKGTTAGETNIFQHQFDIDIKKPAPPSPLPFRFGVRLFPFKTGKEFFEDEGATQSRLLTWFQSMDPRIFNRIVARQIPVGVAGHASQLGDPAKNLALSERRARRVQQMVNDFGGSFAGVLTFAFGELLAGGGKDDNSGFFRRADVAACGQLEGADAAGGPLVEPAGNDPTLCASIAPKAPAVTGGADLASGETIEL